MDKLHVLGTGNAMVTKIYNTCCVLELSEEYFLIDCGGGNGILQRLKAASIDIDKIKHVFLSHEHCDHMLGLVWVIRNAAAKMLTGKFSDNLYIYCQKSLVEKIKTLCGLCLQKKLTKLFDERIIFVSVDDGESKEIIGRQFTFFDVLSTKAEQYGFTFNLCNEKKLCFMGDEPVNQQREHYVQNANWLLCEAFCMSENADRFKPYEKHHSTAQDAGKLASRLNVDNLLLWHTEEATLESRKEAYTADARKYFANNIVVPEDLEVIKLA